MSAAPPTPWNKSITAHRRFAMRAAKVSDLKRLKAVTGGTLNDVVMAIVAGALRAYLQEHDALPDRPLRAMVPVSIRTGDEEEPWTNRVSSLVVDLPTHLADPLERLAACREAMDRAKRQFELVPAEALVDIQQYSSPVVATSAIRLAARLKLADRMAPPVNVIISNVPGPRQPLYLDGAEMRTYIPVSTIAEGMGLNVTVHSYLDELEFGLIACRELVPDLWHMVDLHLDEIDVLFAAAGVSRDDGDGGDAARRRRSGRGEGRRRGRPPHEAGADEAGDDGEEGRRRRRHRRARPRQRRPPAKKAAAEEGAGEEGRGEEGTGEEGRRRRRPRRRAAARRPADARPIRPRAAPGWHRPVMQRAVWTTEGLVVEEAEPGPLADGWARLQVEACGICGTDLHFLDGQLDPPLGSVPATSSSAPCSTRPPGTPDVRYAGVTDGRVRHVRALRRRRAQPVPPRRRPDRHRPRRRAGVVGRRAAARTSCRWRTASDPVSACSPSRWPSRCAAPATPGSVATTPCSSSAPARSACCRRQWRGCTPIASSISARHDHQRHVAEALGLDVVAESDVQAWGKANKPRVVLETVGGAATTLDTAISVARRGGTIVILGTFPRREVDLFVAALKEVTLRAVVRLRDERRRVRLGARRVGDRRPARRPAGRRHAPPAADRRGRRRCASPATSRPAP